ncbi:MAG: ABC transporter permease [Clostridia bacterium]|nr:ABC transporter permease [Clostridia bacterium]
MKAFKYWDKVLILFILILWQVVGMLGIVPSFMLPTPSDVIMALFKDWRLIGESTLISLYEAMLGMGIALIFSFVCAILMDRFKIFYNMFYPVCVISQTVPAIAIAPLLVLWFGFGITPKVLLVFVTCFFPLLVGLVSGFEGCDKNILRLYKSMGAGYLRTLFDVKLPFAMESFFAGLRISASYAVVGAVIAEWLGGEGGLGVYMTRVRKGFQFDRMFAAIIVISLLSLFLVRIVDVLKKRVLRWK